MDSNEEEEYYFLRMDSNEENNITSCGWTVIGENARNEK
jgi:hypothetical protein